MALWACRGIMMPRGGASWYSNSLLPTFPFISDLSLENWVQMKDSIKWISFQYFHKFKILYELINAIQTQLHWYILRNWRFNQAIEKATPALQSSLKASCLSTYHMMTTLIKQMQIPILPQDRKAELPFQPILTNSPLPLIIFHY